MTRQRNYVRYRTIYGVPYIELSAQDFVSEFLFKHYCMNPIINNNFIVHGDLHIPYSYGFVESTKELSEIYPFRITVNSDFFVVIGDVYCQFSLQSNGETISRAAAYFDIHRESKLATTGTIHTGSKDINRLLRGGRAIHQVEDVRAWLSDHVKTICEI